jgi:23S rRNA (uracil1939-C5)-methyltransferase
MQVRIEKLTFGGAGIGRVGGKAIFVRGGIPGEVLEVKITKEKGRYAEAGIEEILRPSSERTLPPCPVFGRCGGCQWQHIAYPSQLRYKEVILKETLERIGGLKGVEIEPIVPSPKEYGYRKRVTLSTWGQKGKRYVGYHEGKSRGRVAIEGCPVSSRPIDRAIFRLAKSLIGASRYPLKRIHIASDDGTAYVDFVPVWKNGSEWLSSIRNHLGEEILISGGKEEFEFNLLGLRFYSAPSVFIQANKEVNELLVQTVGEWANLRGHERILDLYCGIGNFSLYVAKNARDVVGVDVNARSVSLANKSAEANSITNVVFDASPSELFIEEAVRRGNKFDLIILDPPREGAKGVLKGISKLSPERIIYVSCDPPTLARDLKILTELGYQTLKIRPFDMFPQTYHIESVALVSRFTV